MRYLNRWAAIDLLFEFAKVFLLVSTVYVARFMQVPWHQVNCSVRQGGLCLSFVTAGWMISEDG